MPRLPIILPLFVALPVTAFAAFLEVPFSIAELDMLSGREAEAVDQETASEPDEELIQFAPHFVAETLATSPNELPDLVAFGF